MNTLASGSHSPGFEYRAAILVLFLTLFGSHLATPLYSIWQAQLGLSATAITLIFSCYPIGVTAGLLFGGRLGDRFGRKPLIYAGILLTAASSVVYLLAASKGYLVAARLINGVAVGLMSGPAVAAIVELYPLPDRAEASRLSAIVTLASPAAGLLTATLIVHFILSVDLEVSLPFLVQLGGLVVALVLALSFRETASLQARPKIPDASAAPRGVWLPLDIRYGFFFACVTGALCWSNTSLWLSLGPALVAEVSGLDSKLIGGLAVVAFLTAAGVVQMVARGTGYRTTMAVGLMLIPPSLLLICTTMMWKSVIGLCVGAVMGGAGQGLCWMGCSELVNRIAPTKIRASVLSGLYISGYMGSCLPIMATGVLADYLGLLVALAILSVISCLLAVYLVTRDFRRLEGRPQPA